MQYRIRPKLLTSSSFRKRFYRRLASYQLAMGRRSLSEMVDKRPFVTVNNLDWAMNLLSLPKSSDKNGVLHRKGINAL